MNEPWRDERFRELKRFDATSTHFPKPCGAGLVSLKPPSTVFGEMMEGHQEEAAIDSWLSSLTEDGTTGRPVVVEWFFLLARA